MFSRKNNWVDQSVSCPWTHSPEPVFACEVKTSCINFELQSSQLRQQMICKAKNRHIIKGIFQLDAQLKSPVSFQKHTPSKPSMVY